VAGNTVTLTFAGDADQLQAATEQVGNAVEQMADEVGQASRQMATQVGDSEEAFEGLARSSGRLGEALDRASGGFSMMSGGIGDVGGAMTALTDLQTLSANKAIEQEAATLAAERAQRDYEQAVKDFGEGSLEAREAFNSLTAAQQAAKPPSDIAEWGEKLELISPIIMGIVGVTDLMILTNMVAQASWVRTAASMVAARTAMVATTIATGVATAAQWLWNAAMTANPIGIIIVAVAALVAAIVWIATQTDWFGKLWDKIWSGILAYINFVKDNYLRAFQFMGAAGEWLVDRIKWVKDTIATVWGTFFSILTAPFRAAFNFIARAWNSTVGRLSWSVPSWVPGLGGNTISAPKLPTFHQGGIVPGAPGTAVPILALAGERVERPGAGGRTVLELRSGGSRLDDLLVELVQRAVVNRGGDVQMVLGGGSG
jgi:hypothetical protein